MRRIWLAIMVAIVAVAGAGAAQAQAGGNEPAVPVVAEEEAVVPGETGAAFALPPRPAPPRTMAALWPVFALFVASWLAIIAYLLVSGRRVAQLAARFEELEGRQ